MMKLLAYRSRSSAEPRVGLLSSDEKHVTALKDPKTGAPIRDLFDVIEDWDQLSSYVHAAGKGAVTNGAANGATTGVSSSSSESIAEVEILPPLRGRDLLAVGKNYAEHAKEFNASGYDSSDKKDIPDFPVIFTKRASSIVGHGATIYPHPKVTKTLDYEGELGVIIGKGGFGISKANAMDHVWGYTIINDVTARERQRDHKQFYIGKSLDTFAPCGPYVVPATELDGSNLELQTTVNGEVRQKTNTKELIFDIPTLVETISMGITLQPGDMIATGTPAGVGFGLKTPTFLKPGDVVEVSISGIGVLKNTVGGHDMPVPPVVPFRNRAIDFSAASANASRPDASLLQLSTGKKLHVQQAGKQDAGAPTVIFVHGLGGSLNFYKPAVQLAGLENTHRLIYFDLEGHGASPLSGGEVTVNSFADDIAAVLDTLQVEKASVVGHSLGGLIANTFAAKYPARVSKQVLIGPVKALGDAGKQAMSGRAQSVRQQGMIAVADTICNAGLATKTKTGRPLTLGYVRTLLLSTPAEGYALACLALGGATDPDYAKVVCPTLIISGSEDKTAPPPNIQDLTSRLAQAKAVQLEDVGHWHALEDVEAVSKLLQGFMSQ